MFSSIVVSDTPTEVLLQIAIATNEAKKHIHRAIKKNSHIMFFGGAMTPTDAIKIGEELIAAAREIMANNN